MQFDDRAAGTHIETPGLLTSSDEALAPDSSPCATLVEGDTLYFDTVHAGMEWRLAITRDGDGQASFQLAALPPQGVNLREPVVHTGRAELIR